jgi:hypothetical protein
MMTRGSESMDEAWVRALEREIDRLRRRYALLLRELPATRELHARWALAREVLCWIVPLEEEDEILESDIDVEITPELLIVRARPQSDERLILIGLLPVPPGFDSEHPSIRYEEGLLEIRVRHLEDREGGR